MLSLILSITGSIFSIVNPLGAIPLFLSLTSDYSGKERFKASLHTSMYVIAILLVSFFIGVHLLSFFGIDIEALKIAGGIVIFLSGFSLLRGKMESSRSVDRKVKEESMEKDDISFTPMAMPLLAGPGSISFLINKQSEYSGWTDNLIVSISVIIIGVIIFIVLHNSRFLFKVLGRAGLKAMSRIMGFLVMAIGTQYFIGGIVNLVNGLLT